MPQNLTDKEADLFRKLEKAMPAVLTRNELNPSEIPYQASNVVDVHIRNLRKKLEGTTYSVETVRGKGYRLTTII